METPARNCEAWVGVCMLVRGTGMGVWGELEKHHDLTNSILKVFDNFDHNFLS